MSPIFKIKYKAQLCNIPSSNWTSRLPPCEMLKANGLMWNYHICQHFLLSDSLPWVIYILMSSGYEHFRNISWIFKKVSMKESNASSLLATLLKWVPDIYKSWYFYFHLPLKGWLLKRKLAFYINLLAQESCEKLYLSDTEFCVATSGYLLI